MKTPALFESAREPYYDMEKAVEVTIHAKTEAGLIGPEHAALVQLCRELAVTIGAGAPYGKTVVAQASQQLREALAALPSPPDPLPTDDALAAAMRAPTSEDLQ
ncbi:MAG: hypothetical protein SOW43_07320 [Schaalia hyovaginalis]|nr:hypothetical protein [Schaalia hyovaginalis]